MATANHWNGVLDSALDAVGNTPLVRLDRIAGKEGFKCNLMAKVEFFSAGGSVKDRIAKRMVEQAEKDGVLIPGQSVVIEPTSGNTGIGLALTCALKGYKCIITLPTKMSLEKEVLLRSLGAEVVRTPTDVPHDSPESLIGIAHRLRDAIPGGVILDQYSNPMNPQAHFFTTYPEIEHSLQTSNLPRKDVTALIAGAGTGGTISGLAQAARAAEKAGRSGRVTVVAVDPVGSILGGGEPGSYLVEGIGYDFYPDVLDRKAGIIDHWVKTDDSEAFPTVKRIIREEGLLVGGSCGSAMAGALKWLKTTDEGRRIAADPEANVVVVFPDGVRNYMSKEWFLSDSENAATAGLHAEIKNVIGRELGDAKSVEERLAKESVPNGTH